LEGNSPLDRQPAAPPTNPPAVPPPGGQQSAPPVTETPPAAAPVPPSTPVPVYTRVARLRSFVDSILPEGAIVAVVSSGLPTLLDFPGRRAMHFPATESGAYEAAVPATSAALEQLDRARQLGVEFLIIPSFRSGSWLDRHPGFVAELERSYRKVADRPQLCTVFDVTRQSIQSPVKRATAKLFSPLRRRHGGRALRAMALL
jgi:hypothetical protein